MFPAIGDSSALGVQFANGGEAVSVEQVDWQSFMEATPPSLALGEGGGVL